MPILIDLFVFFSFLFLATLWGMQDLNSLTRDQTCAPVLGTWSLNPWTTREVPKLFVFLLLSFESSLYILYLLSDMFLQRHFSPMFSFTHCVVVVVIYRSTVYVGLIFTYSVKDGWSFVFLFLPFLSFFVAIAVYKFSIVPVPFVEEASLSPLHCFCNFVKTQVLYMYRFVSGYFILFHSFVCLYANTMLFWLPEF